MSAVIYCLRCLVRREIPLNQGCLNPVNVIIPEVLFCVRACVCVCVCVRVCVCV
jgi:5-oxoprolinase (ATP-hydrolysing)